MNSDIEYIKIQKDKPMQNGYCERFNRNFREDILDAYIFESMEQLRDKAEQWRDDYKHNHPHAGIGNNTPIKTVARQRLVIYL